MTSVTRSYRPTFSVTHTTARPELWRKSYDAWVGRSTNPDEVEYVLCVDERWGFEYPADEELKEWLHSRGTLNRLVWNTGRKCLVDGANIAASASRGHVVLVNSDDIFPPDNWDRELVDTLSGKGIDPASQKEFVVHTSSGTPADSKGLMVLQILSRARYEKFGYALYPEYTSMYCDDDFTTQARADGVVVDATHLTFFHDHPAYSGAQWDEVYNHENAPEAYTRGKQVFARRQAELALSIPTPQAPAPRAKVLAVCLPGERFHSSWVSHWTGLLPELMQSYAVASCFAYSSNVYETRSMLLENLLASEVKPDFVLWVDDDNLITSDHFRALEADLLARPDVDMVCGWAWCTADCFSTPPSVSAGALDVNTLPHPLSFETITQAAKSGDLLSVDYTGFPFALMRYRVLEAVGRLAFTPIPSGSRWGFAGEDVAFCVAAKAAGMTICVDPRVQVPHLKLRPVGQELVAQTAPDPRAQTETQTHIQEAA